MVLPVRIELTTSALPRMRSTTELRQHGPAATGPGCVGQERRRAGLSTRGAGAIAGGVADGRQGDAGKRERLAAALRANLKRRKVMRAHDGADDAPGPTRDDRSR